MSRPSLSDELGRELAALESAGLYRRLRELDSAQGARVLLGGRELLNFSSNDYLGLSHHPLLRQAATAAVARYGVGAGASRLVCGNLAPYGELEERLARFKAKEAAVVFGSGYAANLGTITALVGAGDVVILDKLDHASIIDGARLSGATVRVYPHGDLQKLEKLLAGARTRADSGTGVSPVLPAEADVNGRDARSTMAAGGAPRRRPRTLIITESVFSMDGDLALLREIVALKDRYGAWLMIDEAHATGLYGPHRRGLAEALEVADRIDITLGTLSKALGAVGGFVCGSRELIDYLRNRARSLIYSTALPPSVCAAASAAVEFVMSDAGHECRDRLWRNVSELKQGLARLGIPNESRSAIIPVRIGGETTAVAVAEALSEQGVLVPAIRYPTVPKGKARLRVTVTAEHTSEEINRFLTALDRALASTGSRRLLAQTEHESPNLRRVGRG